MKYLIYHGDLVVGWSALEYGDPSMGVAHGVFHPDESYSRFRHLYRSWFNLSGQVSSEVHEQIEALKLTAGSETGEAVAPCLAVHIIDPTDELPEEPLEVEIPGIAWETYARLFPDKWQMYRGDDPSE